MLPLLLVVLPLISLGHGADIGDYCKEVLSSINVTTNEQMLSDVMHNLAHHGVASTKRVTSNYTTQQ